MDYDELPTLYYNILRRLYDVTIGDEPDGEPLDAVHSMWLFDAVDSPADPPQIVQKRLREVLKILRRQGFIRKLKDDRFALTREGLTCLAQQAGTQADRKPDAPQAGEQGTPTKPRRGRPKDTDPNADQQIYDAWKTGEHKTYADLGRELGKTKNAVGLAIDRHKKRIARRTK